MNIKEECFYTNSFTTGTGKARTAQILTFLQAKPVEERLPLTVSLPTPIAV